MSSKSSSDFGGVVIAAPVSVAYARYSSEPADWYFAQCLRAMLRASGLDKAEIDGLAASSFTLAPNPVASLALSLGISPGWLEAVPFGGASAVMALRRAARAVQAGDASVVACIGADSNPADGFKDIISGFSVASNDAVFPYGAGGPTMPFAHVTRQYMDATGSSRDDFGRLCVAQRDNAGRCEHALLRKPITLDDYLSAPAISEPFHKLDLVMPCAGAEGFLVLREAHAKALRIPYARILSVVERHNAYPNEHPVLRGGWLLECERLYASAGCQPDDIDVVATYDDCPAIVFMQLEGLGFCAQGQARHLVRDRDLRLGGDFPLNTSGGQLGCGQAGAAGGYLGLVEVLRQVSQQAHGRQVQGARRGAVSGYGMAVYDRCLGSGATLLEGAW
ncbi:thiolase family protein [Variovorax sp. RT4R15]|uniref:thiolase family protein n=1 Tax=Variovorax sp. RT4R15 TaxID=3443737 RepID=UPI003F45F327